MRKPFGTPAVLCASALVASLAAHTSTAGTTRRANLDINGREALGMSRDGSISADGRYVAFSSFAPNLVPGDTNGTWDVFVRDLLDGLTTRVSVSSQGRESDGPSHLPAISHDGRHVAFVSDAANLVPGDTNGWSDVFVHDRSTGTTTRASVSSSGVEGNWHSGESSISGDGRYVGFTSAASNLVPGDTNGANDVFVHDLQTGMTTRASVWGGGNQANDSSHWPSLSLDGRYVCFMSWARNWGPAPSHGKGVFVRDLLAGTTERIDLDMYGQVPLGSSNTGEISADGRFVTFESGEVNLVPIPLPQPSNIYVRDRLAQSTDLVSVSSEGVPADKMCILPVISGDGRHVAFMSASRWLVPFELNGQIWDVFLRDRARGVTTRVSVDSAGTQGNAHSGAVMGVRFSIAAEALTVAFESLASNLVPGDRNGNSDIFVHEPYPSLALAGPIPPPSRSPPPARVGGSMALDLRSPLNPGALYLGGSALAYVPGIPVGRTREVPLTYDPLLLLSLTTPVVWVGFSGLLDQAGQALPRVQIPPVPALAGVTFYSAFVLLRPGAPSGIDGISNALGVTIVP